MSLNNIYLGADEAINKAYLGDTVVFERGGAPSYDPLIDDLITQAGIDGYTAFSGTTLTAADVLIKQWVTDGIINAVGDRGVKVSNYLDAAWLPATNGDSDFACYDILNPASGFNLTKVNSPTFTTNQGFTGGGTAYLDTNFNLSTDGVNFILNSSGIHAYTRVNNNTTGFETLMGAELSVASQRSYIIPTFDLYATLNSTSRIIDTTVDDTGFFQVNRKSSSQIDYSVNNDLNNLSSLTSDALFNGNMFLLGRNRNGTMVTPYTGQISMAAISSDLSSKSLEFYNSIQTYMTSIGSQV